MTKTNDLIVGDKVKVKVYGGEIKTLIITGYDKHHVYVCSQEEWGNSQKAEYKPRSVGFKKEFIVEF